MSFAPGMSLVPVAEIEMETQLLAIATREQHNSLVREAVKIRSQSSNRIEAIKHYLREFCDRDLLTSKESEQLSKICEISMECRTVTEVELAETLRIYYGLIDAGSSPLAIAVAGVAVSSLELAIEHTSKVSAGVASSDVAGTIAGASAGSKVPNPWGPVGGAVGGGIIGGAGASLLAWWEG